MIDPFEFNFVIENIVPKSAISKSFFKGLSIIFKAARQARALSIPK